MHTIAKNKHMCALADTFTSRCRMPMFVNHPDTDLMDDRCDLVHQLHHAALKLLLAGPDTGIR